MSKQKKYVVTGGAGFIGSHLVQGLLREGHRVVVLDNFSTGYREYLPPHENLKVVEVDISNWSELSKQFSSLQGADGLFHLAACARIQPSLDNPALTNDTNVTGTLNVLQMMRMCKIPAIIYSASSSYYGNAVVAPYNESQVGKPETPYAITKYMGELYCKTWGKAFGVRSICLRYFNVYGKRSPLEGPYAPVIGLFFRQALTGQPVTVVGDGLQTRDFTHVTDVVEANQEAMDVLLGPDWCDADGLTINIGTSNSVSIKELAEMVLECLGKYSKTTGIVHVPERPGESRTVSADISLAKQVLDWQPMVSLEEGIADLRNYYLNNIEKIQNNNFIL